jgi:hypothetical protein
VTKVERATEHGRAVFEIEVYVKGAEHDVHVDRVTGAVTRHRVDGSSGSGGHGSDDRGGDDHGSGGHGSDD